MTDTDTPLSCDTLVVGATIAGLTTARDLAMRGYRVLVTDEDTVPARQAVAKATPFIDEDGDIKTLVEELDLSLVSPAMLPSEVLVGDKRNRLPAASVLGIPAIPLAKDVLAIVGWAGGLRAYLDRLTPVLKIGRYSNLADLVRRRMGRRVAERMVAPVVRGTFGVDAHEVGIDETIPELNNAITRAGSLSGAIAILLEEAANDTSRNERGVAGGTTKLIDALTEAITDYHGEIRLGTRIDIAEHDDEGWLLTMTDGSQIRAQSLIYAETDMQQIDRVTLTVPTAQVTTAADVRAVFAGPTAGRVDALVATRTSALWGETGDEATERITLDYLADDSMRESEYTAKALADAEALLGAQLTPTETRLAAAPRFRTQPSASDRPSATVHVIETGAELAEAIRQARSIAAAVHREDFAVPGVSWAQEVNEEFEEDE